MIKNTIFKKVKSIQSKSNSKLYKNFGETTNQKNKLKNDSSDRNNIIQYELNNNFNNNNNNNSENNNKNKIEDHKENDDSLNDENKKHFKQKLSDEPIDLDANDLNDLMKDL
jgi:hypothetical protein